MIYTATIARASRKGETILTADEAEEIDRDLIEGRQAIADRETIRTQLAEAVGLLRQFARAYTAARVDAIIEGATVERDNSNRDAAVLRNELRASDMNVGLLHDQVKKEVEAKTEARALANEAIQVISDVVDGTDHNIERACAFLSKHRAV